MFDSGWGIYPFGFLPLFLSVVFFFFFFFFDSSLVGLYRDRCTWLHVMFHAMLFEKKRKKRTSQNPVVLLSTLIHGGKITDVLKRYSF